MLKEEIKIEGFIGSYGLEDYLDTNSELDNTDYKKKVSDFLTPYIDKNLYVGEYLNDKKFVIAVENGEDQIIDRLEFK